MRNFVKLAAAALLLSGAAVQAAQAETIKIGVENGPHAEIAEIVKQKVAKDGIDLKVIEISDYARPNPALNDGDLDANAFQHKPYLDQQIKDRGYKLSPVANIVVFPIGVYSSKIKSLDELPQGAKFAIPNDPSNGGRALLLLQSKGLIKLKDGSGITPTASDIVDNPKKLKIVEVDAAQVPHYLPDVSAAVINTNYAIEAKLDPAKDAIAREAADSPYVNILVVRTADVDKPWVKTLVKAYNSQDVKDYVLKKYPGIVVPGF
ncbi:MAG TPA: MetQ/NlpA family ABC transporter substrate-binding protein [Candidatus Sulfotelmatobacter sp.]|jgi:D-methionine transport system substrate-binding protein|nr:MetQ/NlpA family ABC transporter substrate-binding protein [Candidatus Sulfotelmatobacter sp.]